MDTAWHRVVRRAARQHGVVSTAQLRAAGLDHAAVHRRVRAKLLHPVFCGVWAVGHPGVTFEGRCVAAVLSAGEDAAVSHQAAAYLEGLTSDRPGVIEVTLLTRNGRARREPRSPERGDRMQPRVHRTRRLGAGEITVRNGVRMTAVPRTLLDLAPRLSDASLVRACHEAHVRHRTSAAEIEACIARNPGRRGSRRLRAAATGEGLRLSVLEDGFVDLLLAAELPLPETNVARREDRVDCFWPDHGLVIELHSFRYHGSRAAFEEDLRRRRRSDHKAFSWGDVFERPAATTAEMRALLFSAGVRRIPNGRA